MPMDIPAIAVVTFPAQTRLDDASLRKLLEEAGPEYVDIPGLRRKYFLSGDGVAGGVYEWDSRARAEEFYNDEWYKAAQKRFGAIPKVVLYDSPAIADGIRHKLEIYCP